MFCFHKWEKWSDPYNGIYANFGSEIGYYHVCQMRKCAKCGVAQVKKLPKLRSLDKMTTERRVRQRREPYCDTDIAEHPERRNSNRRSAPTNKVEICRNRFHYDTDKTGTLCAVCGKPLSTEA